MKKYKVIVWWCIDIESIVLVLCGGVILVLFVSCFVVDLF